MMCAGTTPDQSHDWLGSTTVRLVTDAIISLLSRACAHLDRHPESTVRVMSFNFSSAFDTIRPALLSEKLSVVQVDAPLMSWIVD